MTVFPAHSSDRWKRRQALHSSAQASSSPLRAGRPWPAGPPREERNGQAQRLSLKRWYETVTISKQLDSDRRATYVPEQYPYRGVLVPGPVTYLTSSFVCDEQLSPSLNETLKFKRIQCLLMSWRPGKIFVCIHSGKYMKTHYMTGIVRGEFFCHPHT